MSIEKSIENINNVLNTEVVDRHSFFQLKYFVVGKEPTIQSKLWRCLKELEARRESLKAMQSEIEENNDKITLASIDIKDTFSKTDDRSIVILRQMDRRKKSLIEANEKIEKKIKYIMEECNFFIKAYESLSEKEKIKPFDDLDSQMAYWNEKLSQELQLRGLLGLPIDIELAKTILALDGKVEIKQALIKSLNDTQKRLNEKKEQNVQS